ncbi:MAG TPA: [FeFe] hydrogenase H-cluster radical SAM maturase HydG, partial [Thermodesulfobacteriota bacterium]|nr:[FeFe] hydrogenase H-cluster radical SAM maturase HydG [Thermodesulfobacteriota bacterium]
MIQRELEAGRGKTRQEISDILAKGREAKGLDPAEAAALLQVEDPDAVPDIFAAAREVKLKIYGKRLVLFAPLYVSNFCVNNCRYCGFRRDNRALPRKRLEISEIAEQTAEIERLGHKRILLECGESALSDIDYVEEAIAAIYATKEGNGEIRRVNVNIAATTVDNYRRLKAAKIGTYQLFQETYHRATYEALHEGPKKDYERQVYAQDRAQEAGIDDVGLGVLFGLFDYRFEVLALLHHARHLEEMFGVGPHTISVPRFRPAPGVDFPLPHPVSDEAFKKVVAVLRLAVPYTGMIISTRESMEMRAEVFGLGISQTSAGSRTSPGGYGGSESEGKVCSAQFETADHRPPEEVIRSISELGYLPSFCTACYRRGRTGKEFMDLAKPGEI